ncbi:MAG: hypothetical protein ACK40G_00365 [Cytophagaceae bacterium]
MSKSFWFGFLLCITLFSCGKERIISDEEKKLWVSDRKGCGGKRIVLADSLLENESVVLGIKEDVLLTSLGKPDKSDYFKRSRKIHYYYLENGGQCDGVSGKEGKMLAVEINAVGLVKAMWRE